MSNTVKKVFEYLEDVNGKGLVIFSWSQDCSFIACAGEQKIVYVLDKRGKELKQTALPGKGKILDLQWDKDNEIICILQDDTNYVTLWNVFGSSQLTTLETDSTKAKASMIKWSKTHTVLAVGTDKGSLIFYNKKNQKKIPTVGKHSKKITSGDWNNQGYLVTGAEDKQLTVSSYTSDTVYASVTVKLEPKALRWARAKSDDKDNSQKSITSILAQKSILIFEPESTKTPLELLFEPKYGKIINYSLFGDGYIVVAFTEGYIAHISTHLKELKDEVSSERVFNSSLDAFCTNDLVYKMAVAGEGIVKIYNLSTWKEIRSERIELPKDAGRVNQIEWSNNGQLLLISTVNGRIYGYLTTIPFLTSQCDSVTAILSSFTEIQIVDSKQKDQVRVLTNVRLENEPSFIELGPFHVAAGINNVVWYFMWLDRQRQGLIQGGQFLQKREYYGQVKQVLLNDQYAAVLADGRAYLHAIDPNQIKDQRDRKFPQNENEKSCAQIALTKNFLIILDSSGKLRYHNIQDNCYILEYKHPEKIFTKFFSNFSGTRVLLFDNRGSVYFFQAYQEQLIELQNFPTRCEAVFWDTEDPNLFCVQEQETLITYIINLNYLHGMQVIRVPEFLQIEDVWKECQPVVTILERGIKPLGLQNGFLKIFTPQGTIQGHSLTSHSFIDTYKGADDDREGHFRYFLKNLSLNKFNNCIVAAEFLDSKVIYDVLGRKALHYVELDVALQAFQKAQNLGMVMTIKSFIDQTERNLVFGNVAMILGEYDLAQDFYLQSSNPLAALEMRSDIQDNLIALNLSKNIAPHMEPIICKKLALQIETQGNPQEARKMYEKAILENDDRPSEKQKIDQHNIQCFAGIARTSIKSGDIQRGFTIAKELQDKETVIEIAVVCENLKQHVEAAELYEKADMLEKAAALYIQLKMFKQAAPLMNKIKSPVLLRLYAKSKESEGAYKEAEKAYEKAEDWENVVRLNLNQLDNFDKAKQIVREQCQTVTCAAMIAAQCEKKGFKEEAVEFLIMAGKKSEAFAMAQSSGVMDSYATYMKDFTQEDHIQIADYWVTKEEWLKAASHYEKSNNPAKALKLYFKAGDQYIDQMIDLVAKYEKQEALVQSLLDYLMGELDNVQKNPTYLLKFYYTVGNYKATTQIGQTIATDEQDQGNYKTAHGLLFDTYIKLREKKFPVSSEMEQKLMILHSYLLVIKVIKLQDRENAAWLLNRVCTNISQFPAHAVKILTSAVIEASKASLKAIAYKWAVELIRPEYRKDLDEKYKAKIENIARKPIKEEIEENKSECPFCKNMVGEYQLDCKRCLNQIPFCIASGKHILLEQLCFCPSCKFPANINYFRKLLQQEGTCPMCNEIVREDSLQEAGEQELQQLKQQRIAPVDPKQ